MGSVISNLNLDGLTSQRAQPGHLVWGPDQVPSTSAKKMQRILAWTGFVSAFCGLLAMAVFLYVRLQG